MSRLPNACFAGAVMLMVLGGFTLSRLPLDKAGLFFGVLQLLAVTLLYVLVGLVLPLAVELRRNPAK
jgi:hypothetical protein